MEKQAGRETEGDMCEERRWRNRPVEIQRERGRERHV